MSRPPVTALFLRSTRDKRGNYLPMLATVRSYRILQRLVFVCCPITRTCRRRVDFGDQCTMPSIITTLNIRSTQNMRGNCNPIYPMLLLALLVLARIRHCSSQTKTTTSLCLQVGPKLESSRSLLLYLGGRLQDIRDSFSPPSKNTKRSDFIL
jgi:hypothetical protein